VRRYLDLVGAENLAEGHRLVVEERLAQVVKVGWGELQEHLEFTLLVVVKGFVEIGLSFAAGDRSPVFRANHRLQ
jgi:hypothetical protein